MSKEEAEKKEETKKGPAPVRKGTPRKELPSVAYLLAHGDPETAHLPKTWAQKLTFPLIVSVVFFISLLTFHYAPHETSSRKKFKYQLPQHKKIMKGPVTVNMASEAKAKIEPETERETVVATEAEPEATSAESAPETPPENEL